MKKDEGQLIPTDPKSSEMSLYSEALIKAQQERHKTLDKALDTAMGVVQRVLDDPTLSDAAKMYPAKLAVDTYMMKERMSREDLKLELEKEKLIIERAKLSVPGGPLYVQNNQTTNNTTVIINGKEAKKQLQGRKKMQAAILEEVSGIPQTVSEDEIDKK